MCVSHVPTVCARVCSSTLHRCSIAAKLKNCTGPEIVKDPNGANKALWEGMAMAQKMGLVKSIGVSN